MMCISLRATMVIIKASRQKQSSVVLYDLVFYIFVTPVSLIKFAEIPHTSEFHIEMVNQLFNIDLFLTHALLASFLSSPNFLIVIFFHFSVTSTTFQCFTCMIESGMSMLILISYFSQTEAKMAKIIFQCVCVHSQKEELP